VIQTLKLNISGDLYNRIKKQAEVSHRSIEAEAAIALESVIPEEEDIPARLKDIVESMALLDDEALERAACNTRTRDAAEKIRKLRARRKSKGLTTGEQDRLATLLRQYDEGILIRAEAAALLKRRGKDVNGLLKHK
jgi:hypothetical protein